VSHSTSLASPAPTSTTSTTPTAPKSTAPTSRRTSTKDLLAAAARDGQADAHWRADGVDRLYFHDPADVNSAGYVEVARAKAESGVESEAEPDAHYVKIEVWVPPARGAEVVALVTGGVQALEERLRYEIRRELAEEMRAEAEKAEAEEADARAARAEAEAEAKKASEPEKAPARVPVKRTGQDIKDAQRAAELDRLIEAQADDED